MPKTSYPSRMAQYKHETEYVARSLGKVAKQYGYFSPRLGREHGSSPQKYTLETREFLPMAQYIAQHEIKYSYLPQDFFLRLDRAIQKRQQTQTIHCEVISDQSSSAKHSNSSHRFFTSVLVNVSKALQNQRTLVSTEKLKLQPLTSNTNQSTAQSASTAFESAETDIFYVAIDLHDDIQERLAILMCLIDDFNEIETLTQQLWSRYRTGEMNLVEASLATNSALEMAQVFEKEFSDSIGDTNEIENLLGTLWAAHCVTQKQNPALSLEDKRTPDIIYEVSSSFFWPLRLILRGYLQFRTLDRLPTFKPNYFGKREVLGAYSQLNARQKFHVDKMVLTDALPHFDVIARMREHLPDFDEVTVGMCSMFETGNIPLWLTLALRVFLDIHYELDGNTRRAYQELEGATNYFEKTMTEIQSSQTTYKPANWPSSGDKCLQDFVDELRFMHSSDQIQEFVSERTDSESPDHNFTFESHHLLKCHPLSCGIKLYAIRAKYHDLSVKYANTAGTVISCAHLYHALKTERFLASTWPDMELFLYIHEGDQIFAGCVPRKPRAYLFQYSTLLRKVSEAFPPAGLQFHHHTARPGYQPLAPLAHATRLFVPRYVYGVRQCNIVPIEAQMLKIERERRAIQRSPENETSADTKNRIDTLCAKLHQDVLEFFFDYFQFHQSCQIMLGKIKNELQDFDFQKVGNVLVGDAQPLPALSVIVLQCLADLPDDQSIRRSSPESCTSGYLELEIVQRAAACIDAVSSFELIAHNCCFGELSCLQISRMCNANIQFRFPDT